MLEPLVRPDAAMAAPRASLLARPGELCPAGIWMGGAHTQVGDSVGAGEVAAGWVIDCAGDLPRAFREQAQRWTARVFADVDAVPADLDAIVGVADEAVEALRAGTAGLDRLYVMCQHGMNRSGLVAGLVLRGLGLAGEEAVARIVAARPGALSNQAFRALVAHPQR